MSPPFRPGQKVWTDWLRTNKWEPVEVERCERTERCQSGWIIHVRGGMWASIQDALAKPPRIGHRIVGADAGWFRDRPPEDRP
jgi:hypothetical protein